MTATDTPSRRISQRTLNWEDRTAWPMFVLAIVFFASWMWLAADPHLSAQWSTTLPIVIATCWIIFIADYVVRLLMSGNRREFLRTRWFEGVSLIIAYLRPFVILAYIWRLPWFRATPGRQRARLLILVSMFTFLFVLTGSSLVWLVEHGHPGANIINLDDAIWWGFTTIATVGYGDFVPVTTLGRTIAVGLMMGGLVVLGVTSAAVISTLTDQIHRATKDLATEREQAEGEPAGPHVQHPHHPEHRTEHPTAPPVVPS